MKTNISFNIFLQSFFIFQTKKNCRNILNKKLIFLITNILELISREKVDRLSYDCIRQRISRGVLRCKICTAEIGYRSVKTIERSRHSENRINRFL